MLKERVKKAREDKDLTQVEVAKRLGISQPAYSYYENGDRIPSLAVAKRLARLFGCSIDYLVGEE